MNEKVVELAGELGAHEVKQGKDWKGYKVFKPIYKENPIIGYPYVILAKDNKARICDPEESLEYFDYEKEEQITE